MVRGLEQFYYGDIKKEVGLVQPEEEKTSGRPSSSLTAFE